MNELRRDLEILGENLPQDLERVAFFRAQWTASSDPYPPRGHRLDGWVRFAPCRRRARPGQQPRGSRQAARGPAPARVSWQLREQRGQRQARRNARLHCLAESAPTRCSVSARAFAARGDQRAHKSHAD